MLGLPAAEILHGTLSNFKDTYVVNCCNMLQYLISFVVVCWRSVAFQYKLLICII